MKNKWLKRVLTTMVAIGMVLMTQTSNVSAEISADSKVQVTITGVENGTELSMYKIIDIQIENGAPKAPVYTWVTGVQNWVKDNYPSYIGENHEVTTEFKNLLEDVEKAKSFYEKMAAEIHRSPSTIAITAAKTATASAPSVTLTDIGLGYYLICAKHGVEQVYTPTGFNIAPVEEEGTWSVNDQTVTMKSSTPTIVKTVIDPTDTTVAITDSVCYQLTAQIPTYPEDASAITFAIGDKLSEGLTLKPDTIAVKEASGKEIAATNYDVKKDPGKTAKLTDYTFEIVFKEAYIKANPMLNVQVTYDAEVNDKALTMDALKNIAYIGYNHDPYDTQSYKEKTTEKLVYTYGIKVLKVGESGTDILKNAEFTLSKDGTSLKFKKATDGSYVINPKGDTVLTVGTDG